MHDYLAIIQSLASVLLGGLIAIASAWLTDRRKSKRDDGEKAHRQRVILSAVFAVRNHIVETLNASHLANQGDYSELKPALTALNTLIGKMPFEQEAVAISLVSIALKLDIILSIPRADSVMRARWVGDILGTIEMLDVVMGEDLTMLNEEDLTSSQTGYA